MNEVDALNKKFGDLRRVRLAMESTPYGEILLFKTNDKNLLKWIKKSKSKCKVIDENKIKVKKIKPKRRKKK